MSEFRDSTNLMPYSFSKQQETRSFRVPCRLLQGHPNFSHLKIIALAVYQDNRKWLFLGVNKPSNQNDIEFLNRIGRILDYYFQKYNNVAIIEGFNITTENTHHQRMIQTYNLNNLIKEPTCFRSNNPSPRIDLLLTNQKIMYKFSNTFETDLSDHQTYINCFKIR